jgi:L-aminopeptidase/D-esterase-like protein
VLNGVRVGSWTDAAARTGCTVVRFPPGTVASCEVRGGAPATRELELLAPHRTVQRLDAVVLSGGSAFGLAAVDGVLRVLEQEGQGFETRAGVVPIVVGLSLYDLGVGDPSVRPGPAEGELACRAAAEGSPEAGRVGAGAGATVGKWRGARGTTDGGLGYAMRSADDVEVAALVAVNAFGDVLHPGEVPPPVVDTDPTGPAFGAREDPAFGNTVIGVVVTNAALDKTRCLLVAQGGHDGLARAVHPPHTTVDGDAVVAAALGRVEAAPDAVRALAVETFAAAVRAAVTRP